MSYEKELRCGLSAVRDACSLCRGVQKTLVSEETLAKKDKSPVTIADLGVQAVINLMLMEQFPEDRVIGEEDASLLRAPEGAFLKQRTLEQVGTYRPEAAEDDVLAAIDHGASAGGATGRFWILDPIDGTKGFLRGDQYAIALALMENGRIVMGILGCPNLPVSSSPPDGPRGCIFAATRDEGATMQALDTPLKENVRVAATTDPADAVACESVEAAHSAHDLAAQVVSKLGISQPPFRIDSQCKYAAVARGDASIYLRLPTRADYEEKVWDHAAGWLLVKEAGGDVTDIHGQPLDFSRGRTLRANSGVVATNGHLHRPVTDVLRTLTRG